jgi:biotin operon repressor
MAFLQDRALGWSREQAEAVAMALQPEDHPTQAQMAARLGISRQAVAARLQAAGFANIKAAEQDFYHVFHRDGARERTDRYERGKPGPDRCPAHVLPRRPQLSHLVRSPYPGRTSDLHANRDFSVRSDRGGQRVRERLRVCDHEALHGPSAPVQLEFTS